MRLLQALAFASLVCGRAPLAQADCDDSSTSEVSAVYHWSEKNLYLVESGTDADAVGLVSEWTFINRHGRTKGTLELEEVESVLHVQVVEGAGRIERIFSLVREYLTQDPRPVALRERLSQLAGFRDPDYYEKRVESAAITPLLVEGLGLEKMRLDPSCDGLPVRGAEGVVRVFDGGPTAEGGAPRLVFPASPTEETTDGEKDSPDRVFESARVIGCYRLDGAPPVLVVGTRRSGLCVDETGYELVVL